MLRTASIACVAAFAATSFAQTTASSTPVAWVYVSNLVSPNTSTKHNIYAYGARSDGSLFRVAGTPLNNDIKDLWDNSHYLFGLNGSQIDSYWISSTGALQLVGTVDAAAHATNPCGGIGPLKVDHSGHSLYNPIAEDDCMGFSFQNFAINNTTGSLTLQVHFRRDFPQRQRDRLPRQ
jgi:hypothetical protein